MRDWNSVQIAEQNHHLHQQPQPQPQQTQYHLNVLPQEFQQILAPRNLAAAATTPASSGHFLGEISREPMSPPQPPHFLNYFNKRNDSSSPVGGPGSSFKHLFCAPTISDRGGECNDDQQQDDLWSSEEARKLIKLRRELDLALRDFPNPQSHLWDEISRMFGAMGCLKSPKNCKEKFERMTQYYKKVREPNGKLPGTEQFFGELEAFYGSNSGLTMCGGEVQKDGNAGDDNLASPEQQQQQQHQNHHQHQQLNYHVNSSSESAAEYDDPSEEKHLDLKKRKRKSKAARMASMENFVRRFIDRQEEMQKNFLELLEKREQERVKREEAWREQLVTRLTREYDLRAEDHARRMSFDGVIAAALQKATGTEVEIPQGPLPSPYFSNLDESNNQEQQQQHHQHHHHQQQEQQLQNHHGCDSANKRWLKDEVLVLIQLRAAMEPKFQEVGPKGPFWEEISVGLAARGYKRWSAKRCKEKWENINKYFRKTSNKRRPENTKTCPYFRELDILYQKGIIGGVRSLPSNISNNNINNNNSSRIEETTDELDRDDSSHADAEVLSIMPTSCDQAATPSNNNPTAVLFSSPEINCAQNTESCRIQKNSSSSRESLKRSWGELQGGGGGNGSQGGGGGNGSLALSFDALQGAELLCGNSNKTLKFDELLAQQQQQQCLMSERQSQEFQEAESSAPSRGCNLVDGFGIRSLGERR